MKAEHTTLLSFNSYLPSQFVLSLCWSSTRMLKMQIWLCLSIVTCLVAQLNANKDSNSNAYGSNNFNSINKEIQKPPMELNINFTFPANGLPPLKLNLGNVAAFLKENDTLGNLGLPSSGKPIKKTIMVNITNPNKPRNPIPAEVFNAGLPQGFQIPVKPVQLCRDFIVSKCKDLCKVSQRICHSTCDGRKDCVQICKATESSCGKFCDSTFDADGAGINKGDGQKMVDILLPKCLRNCRNNKYCTYQCHDTCHTKLKEPAPLTNVLSTVPLSLPAMTSPSMMTSLSIMSKPSKGDSTDVGKENDSETGKEKN
ncbi:hypothetical protein GHT06_021949 [Daphnia sinensis]|uniref:Uncharacterized protein n=1 Tax=Daphnia sinensis TaxID=1820382 RepID=A0AAD5KGD9_9CRUS|nr:hypothetical protein GHT06_021949 [Daphnia sinensis]